MNNKQTTSGKEIQISRGRRRAMAREDFIVRGYGKRAVRIVLLANYHTLENTSKLLSKDELTSVLTKIAKEISKRGWKTCLVNISFFGEPAKHARVYVKNPSRCEIALGEIGSLIECD